MPKTLKNGTVLTAETDGVTVWVTVSVADDATGPPVPDPNNPNDPSKATPGLPCPREYNVAVSAKGDDGKPRAKADILAEVLRVVKAMRAQEPDVIAAARPPRQAVDLPGSGPVE